MKKLCGLLVPICGLIAAPALGFVSDSELLLHSYLRYSLAQEVRAQALTIAGNIENDADVEQVHVLVNEWFGSEIESMRADLDQRFGDGARSRFEAFVGEYTVAENAGDTAYLETLSAHIELSRKPADYASLRQLAIEQWLPKTLSEAIKLLSETETWTEMRNRRADVPSFETWLLRDAAPSPPPARPARPVNPLAAAEAPASEWGNTTQRSPASALDGFAQRRRERREQAMQSAQAGMQQMALERQAAEEEYAARKLAEAEAEAEAMRAQAQRLAASEAEAMAQRENSWGNRIKRVVGGTLTAGLGAFTGGIGAEAGSRAAAEMFR